MNTIFPFLYVAAGGAVGSALRYGIDLCYGKFFHSTFPIATLFINISASLLMGFLAALAFTRNSWLGENGRFLLMTGFCGGYSTLSALSLQTLVLLRTSHWWYAALNVIGTPLICLLAVWGGYNLGFWVGSGETH